MENQVKTLTNLTGSAGDIWRAWEVTLNGVTYHVQESRIGYQVLKQAAAGGRKNAAADEKQHVIGFLEDFLSNLKKASISGTGHF